ncbi:MAG: hypothetical protein KC547_20350 [Anaerolineae bacterium]|nr:hypothetical protein [Anaerolineae bacterium]
MTERRLNPEQADSKTNRENKITFRSQMYSEPAAIIIAALITGVFTLIAAMISRSGPEGGFTLVPREYQEVVSTIVIIVGAGALLTSVTFYFYRRQNRQRKVALSAIRLLESKLLSEIAAKTDDLLHMGQ